MTRKRRKARFKVGQVVRTKDWKGEPWLGVVTKAYFAEEWQYWIARERTEVLVQDDSELRPLNAREKGSR